jgi:outer membrane protein
MKNTLIIIFAAGLIFLSVTAFAQSTLKIGHVDINLILNSLPARDSAAAIMEKETKEVQATYEEMTAEYNRIFDDYEKVASTLPETVKKVKEAELLDKQKRLEEFQQNATSKLDNRNAELLKPILDKILKVVDKVAADNGFTYILDVSKGSVVFTSKDSQNINPLVLKILKPI